MSNIKIEREEELTTKELLMLSLLCFMDSENSLEMNILNSTVLITNIPDLNKEVGQFVKGILLVLCDQFVKDESLNKTISNLVGGNMKIVEDYAQRKVEERNKEFVISLEKEGFGIQDITRIADVKIDFVKKILSK